jgi:SAM-dependent methyltransferase
MGRSFDRVAAIYDATRGLSPEVEAAIADGFARLAGATPATTFLEVGVGTGRIALPLVRDGFRYAGVDLSGSMLAAAQGKAVVLPGCLLLAHADAVALPFAAAAFDAGIVVHVFHLIRNWPLALNELLRVIKPGGRFLYGFEHWLPTGGRYAFDQQWRAILARYGAAPGGHGTTDAPVFATLERRGLRPETTAVAAWQTTTTVATTLAGYTSRTFSSSWTIPDDIFARAGAELAAWAQSHYPDTDATLTVESRFSITHAAVS